MDSLAEHMDCTYVRELYSSFTNKLDFFILLCHQGVERRLVLRDHARPSQPDLRGAQVDHPGRRHRPHVDRIPQHCHVSRTTALLALIRTAMKLFWRMLVLIYH